MLKWFSNFQPTLLKRKIKIKFLSHPLKILTNSKDGSESRIKFLFRLSFSLTGWFFPVYFRNNFQDHRRLSEQLLESQAANGKPEQVLKGLLEGFLKLETDFIEASRSWIFFTNRQQKMALIQKVLFGWFRTFTKIFIRWHYHFHIVCKCLRVQVCYTVAMANLR